LNGKCNNIIDSRISLKCDNGLIICENCGSCCSHDQLRRRLEKLKLTGGYINPNLIKSVNEKLAHLERGEYFCYKCKARMNEEEKGIFKCSNCLTKYDTNKYKSKRVMNLNLKL
jgi:ribosomal protein L37AE/L43A